MLQNKPYYKKIKAADTLPNIVQSCLEVCVPLIFVAFTHNNQNLAYDYFDDLEKKMSFIYCDI